MKNKFLLAALGCVALSLWGGCDLINPEEPIPAYLYVTGFDLETNATTEGTNSHKITDVWVSVDGNFLGAYTLPALIPVLETGEHAISLDAGIKDNGISATPEIYPFYQTYQVTVDLAENETDTLRPVTRYKTGVKFSLIEPFESTNHQFRDIRNPAGATGIQISSEDAFEGDFSGLITLDSSQNKNYVEISSLDRFRDLMKDGVYVYLELNYKSQVPVIWGVTGHLDGGSSSTLYDPGFVPKEEWNKIYFNLSKMIFDGDFDEYQVSFQAFIPVENGKPSLPVAKIWLDNIKLVHF